MKENVYLFMTKTDERVFCEAREVVFSSLFGFRRQKKYWVRVVAPWLVDESFKMPISVDTLEQAMQIAVNIRVEKISTDDLLVKKVSDRHE